jgi:hypothetical protein
MALINSAPENCQSKLEITIFILVGCLGEWKLNLTDSKELLQMKKALECEATEFCNTNIFEMITLKT